MRVEEHLLERGVVRARKHRFVIQRHTKDRDVVLALATKRQPPATSHLENTTLLTLSVCVHR
jgi:hypothetical protein